MSSSRTHEHKVIGRSRSFLLLAIIVCLIVAFDQVTKALIRRTLPLNASMTVIPGLFDFHHIVNKGAAFGIFQNATAYFLVIAIIMVGAIILYLARSKRHGYFEIVTLALIMGGAVGNAIDRAVMDGCVTDFIATTFMDFPIFNVADSSITIGCILLVIWVLVHNRNVDRGAEIAADSEEHARDGKADDDAVR